MKKISELPKGILVRLRNLEDRAWHVGPVEELFDGEFLHYIGLLEASTCTTIKVNAQEFVSASFVMRLLESLCEDSDIGGLRSFDGELLLEVTPQEVEYLKTLINQILRKQPDALLDDEPVDISELQTILGGWNPEWE